MEGSFLAADFPLPSPKSQTLPAYRRIGGSMSEPLPALEKDRSEVLRQISHLGDLRPGSIGEGMGR
jgi:hypothetical protein